MLQLFNTEGGNEGGEKRFATDLALLTVFEATTCDWLAARLLSNYVTTIE